MVQSFSSVFFYKSSLLLFFLVIVSISDTCHRIYEWSCVAYVNIGHVVLEASIWLWLILTCVYYLSFANQISHISIYSNVTIEYNLNYVSIRVLFLYLYFEALMGRRNGFVHGEVSFSIPFSTFNIEFETTIIWIFSCFSWSWSDVLGVSETPLNFNW